MRAASAAEAQLAAWLERLVALLRSRGGEVARLLHAVVQGREAVLELDAARLRLRADAGEPLAVRIEPAEHEGAVRVRTSGDALREVIEGRALLDAVIADGRLDLRAPLADLLAFHELVQRVLALASREPGLRALWAEFDAHWPGQRPRCLPLDEQAARHGALCDAVPLRVRQARSPLFEDDEPGRLS
ncbi:MAG: hypothetical protein JSR38_06175 [Proteobacteria bacterium]|uniref:hypothetical protein n=1 Tax=Piscinibacter sp. TaxID=1903157 RepID=UPI001B5B3026|nr:hypothetical protein [Piscinibacter sp.]MBP5989580.1 hypothetical protein [Piscinibacter sp.]MBP6029474.1 hypothetical protein [Piscinibacter sp.]MBS0441515.1 hypothetical protein [Pseudomonadota bacterium]